MRPILTILRSRFVIALAGVALLIGILVLVTWPAARLLLPARMGAIAETWEASNETFKVRVDRHFEENGGFVAGAYYVFRSAPSGSDDWRNIMTFRHDDPVEIPRDQVRFLNGRVGFVFMDRMYAVTTDGGVNWSVCDIDDLPQWNYRVIKDVHLEPDGTGTLTLDRVPDGGQTRQLYTKDFGGHWSL